MSDSLRFLATRELGQFPVSIGTSLALQALADTYPDRPAPRSPTIDQFDEVWINVRTVYRNLHSCLGKESRGLVKPEDLLSALKQELNVIDEVIGKMSGDRVKAVFYICNYGKDNELLKRKFPNAEIVEPKTALQKVDDATERFVMKPFLHGEKGARVEIYEVYPRTQSLNRVIMLTHIPLDLVHRHDFGKLSLLESHTGKIKPHTQFYTKLKDQRDGVTLPFTEGTLQVFGDSGRMFAMQSAQLRDYVAKVARDGKWTAATTRDRILLNLSQHPMANLQALATKLLR